MGWKPFKKLGKALKKGARKLKSNLKKHGPKLLGLGLGLMVPGVSGLLGKAIGGMTGNMGLGSALSQGFGNIGKGGLKGLLGQAMAPLKGRSFKNLLFGGQQMVDSGTDMMMQNRTGLFGSDMFQNYAKKQLGNELGRGGPQMGGMEGMQGMPPGLLGLLMKQRGQGAPQQGGGYQQQQQAVPYQEQGIENYMGGQEWTGI
jgi:hypothetical protein